MVLTDQELHRPVVFPFEEDRATTARVASFFSLIASAVVLVSPVFFFGLSETPLAWNFWLTGTLMVSIACTRLTWPGATTFMGWGNVILGIWSIFSPFIFGYVDNTALLTASIAAGSVVTVLSYLSRMHSARLVATRSLSSDNDAY